MRHSPTHEEIHDKTTAHTPRHRLQTAVERFRWPTLADLRAAGTSKIALAGSVLTILALAALASSPGTDAGSGAVLDTAAFTTTDRAARADRSLDRGAIDAPASAVDGAINAANQLLAPELAARMAAETQAKQAAEAAQAAEAQRQAEAQAAAARAAAVPAPVAGLDQTQMNNAKRIVQAGQAMGLPKRAYVIAVATSMQECNLFNLASTVLPDSYNYPNEGSGSDHDSVGLFQQRPSSGWGAVSQIMDPGYAATAFYRVLVTVPGWDSLPLTAAAQRVQVSAYPDAYAKHEGRAQAVVDALVG
jgi:hypothetical protein